MSDADPARRLAHGLVESVTPTARWDEVRWPAASRELVEALTQRQAAAVLLFFGPAAATGRAAAAIAARRGVPLYRIDLGRVVSKFAAETEENLDRVFAAVADARAVLLFDEADALFGRRSDVRDAHDRYASLEVGELLQRIAACDGLAILATNRRGDIAPEVATRCAAIVELPAEADSGDGRHGR